MKFPALLVSDLHLTANVRDAYRWELFPWLHQQCAKYQVESLAILGDLTDAKDYHSAELVNKVVNTLNLCTDHVSRVYILQGNHDYLRAGHMFFDFLNGISGITTISKVMDTAAAGENCLWLPHTKNPAKDWARINGEDFHFIFMHQTIKGAVASNGQEMEGEQLPDLSKWGKIYSGDIHVPQTIGPIEYVGSPYHVHFGDSFRPRALVLFENGEREVLRFPSIKRLSITLKSLDDIPPTTIGLRKGDQVKIAFHLERGDIPLWKSIERTVRNAVASTGAEIFGIKLVTPQQTKRVRVGRRAASNPEDAVFDYVSEQQLGSDFFDLGLEFINATR